MQIDKINHLSYAEKGIGSMLASLFKRPPPTPEDVEKGKASFDDVMSEIKNAKDSAVDLRDQLERIQLNDDPETLAQINSKLSQITKETNRFQRIVQAPDQKPHFWEYILHPGQIRRTSRDQIGTFDRDDRRLEASRIRDDLNLAYENAQVMKDIAKELEFDPSFQLKTFSTKSTLEKKVGDLQRYLDIMIDSLDKTVNDMTSADKAYSGTNKKMSQKKIKADYSEKATIEAAIKYYRAVRSTVTNETSQKLFGFGGDDNGDPEATITDMDINGLVDSGAPQGDIYSTVAEWNPAKIDTITNDFQDITDSANDFLADYDPNGNPQEQQRRAQQIIGNTQNLMESADQFYDNGYIPEGVYNAAAAAAPIMQTMQPFTNDNAYYGDYSTAGAFGSYSMRSLMISRKNWEAPLPIKGGLNPKALVEKARQALSKGKQAIVKLASDKKKVTEVKKKVEKRKKKKSQI